MTATSAGGAERAGRRHASPASIGPDETARSTVACFAFIPRMVRVTCLRRHPIACALLLLVLLSALDPLPPLVDVVSGAPPGDAELSLPVWYVVLAPASNTLDALTFLSLDRARWLLAVWVVALAAWGYLQSGTRRRRVARALAAALVPFVAGAAAALLPRPAARLSAADSSVPGNAHPPHPTASPH